MWTPATRRARKLGGTYPGVQRDEIFFMTDLSYSDLVVLTRIQQLTDADGTTAIDGVEPCAETTCDRVALVPGKDNLEFPCARYRLWFGRDDRLLRRAELDDPEGRLTRRRRLRHRAPRRERPIGISTPLIMVASLRQARWEARCGTSG